MFRLEEKKNVEKAEVQVIHILVQGYSKD